MKMFENCPRSLKCQPVSNVGIPNDENISECFNCTGLPNGADGGYRHCVKLPLIEVQSIDATLESMQMSLSTISEAIMSNEIL
jgi:hypothetical protein